MATRNDGRSTHRVRPEPEAEQRLNALTAMALRVDVGRARMLAKIHRSRAFRLCGCATITEYGARLGLRREVTRDLVEAGYMLDAMPEAEVQLLSGKVSFRRAGARLAEWS